MALIFANLPPLRVMWKNIIILIQAGIPAVGESMSSVDTRRITSGLSRSGTRPGRGTLAAGQVLQQRYQIMGVLGVGGMSAVYQARDLRFPNVTKLCAVKEMVNMAPDPQLRALAVQNFEREANILATLSHPAIPKVYDYFSEHNRSYLVIELVDGQDLEGYMNDHEGLLPPDLVLDWALQLCEVLAYLHTYKPPIVFRDMKPANVMLDGQGRIRLIDFGIAKLFQAGQKGTMIGTEGYSPPEQYRGIADPRGDVYALGATLHHLLTKQDPRIEPPFSFQDRPIKAMNPAAPDGFVAVIERALQYEADKRWGNIQEMHQALMALRPQAAAATASEPGTVNLGSGDLQAIWRFACEDEVRSTPAVSEGIVYVGAYDNNLYAIDAKTGQFVWKYPTDGGIASSPCVFEDRVLFGSEDKSLYAVDRVKGRIIWTCPTQDRIRSSPRVEFGHVFFGADDGNLYAVNIQNGRVAWKCQTGGAIRCRPIMDKENIYFGSLDSTVYAVNMKGSIRWRFVCRRGVTSSPALAEGLIFIGSEDNHIYGLDCRSGWSVWRFRTGKPIISSPAVADGVVYVGSADHTVYALQAQSGRVVWKFTAEDQVTSSPAVWEGAVYVGCVDGCVYSLDARSGALRWKFKTGGPVTSSPTIAGGVIYIGSLDKHVYALPA
jgi:outer membrane protein assembly factor BamB/tRNA A-37 threonylcarbamoyl transferase component Bud32